MSDIKRWEHLPVEIMVIIVQKLSFMEDFFKLSAVCKSWKSNISDLKQYEKPPLRLQHPILLLGKQISEAVSDGEDFGDDSEEGSEEDDSSDQDMIREYNVSNPHMIREYYGSYQYMIKDEESDQDMTESSGQDMIREDDKCDHQDMSEEDDDSRGEEDDDNKEKYGHSMNSVDNSCSFLSISSGTAYNIELPEARERAVLGTNKGWLITLGRDFQINLLHPLLRHQIPLPPMLTFPSLSRYRKGFPTGRDRDTFLRKVVLSSTIPVNSKFCHPGTESTPIIMTIFGVDATLAFIRLGDKEWTVFRDPTPPLIIDIVCHKKTFYAVDLYNSIYVCDINECRATKISGSTNTGDWRLMYLVESSSGLDLFAVARFQYNSGMCVFRTVNFQVWKLELKYSDSSDIPSHTWTESNNLGNESIFIGLNSSVSLPSSGEIEPNCIYFTDDGVEYYYHRGDSYDAGIFDLQTRKIKTFQAKPPSSDQPVSPTLWYI